MVEVDPRDYGKLEAQVERIIKDVDNLSDEIKQLKESIQAIRDLMEQSKGGWKTLVYLGGVASAFGGLVSWLAAHIKFT